MEELRAESIRERLREFVSERDTALLERYVQIISEEFARALGLPKIMFGIVYSKRLIFEQINRFGTLRITNSGVFRESPDIY